MKKLCLTMMTAGLLCFVTASSASAQTGPKNSAGETARDEVGGVAEYHPNKHLVLRFDAGDVIIPFSSGAQSHLRAKSGNDPQSPGQSRDWGRILIEQKLKNLAKSGRTR